MTYEQVWDLESVFSGGSNSPELKEKIEALQTDIDRFGELVKKWTPEKGAVHADKLATIFNLSDDISNGLSQGFTFSMAHLSAKQDDQHAPIHINKLSLLATQFSNYSTELTKKIETINNDDWQALLADEPFQSIAFRLNEERDQAKELLSLDLESAINQLSVDGFNGWSDMYDDLVASVTVKIERDGELKEYSAAQADNLLTAAETPEERTKVLEAWETAWQEKAPLFQTVLNHLSGFRLNNYELHGKDSYMEKPLKINRMKEETLDVMWETIDKNKDRIVNFLNKKAELMGLDQLGWADVEASLPVEGADLSEYTYDEAADFIVKNFRQVSPQMANLAQRAFDEAWIEAEDRPNKRPGGYCADLPESGQSRIYMTFSGSADNVSTLAHELGHAFHSHVLRDEPRLNQEYAMNVAETASTFAELVVTDATIQAANSDAEKLTLLDQKNSRAAVMFMNIHARYIFERNFYDQRQKGLVTTDQLNDLMKAAQQEAFQDALSSYHPTFWASKGHFYGTDVPFYNFPYTFGFLFSLGIYAQAESDPDSFEERYINLLKDTASMSTEDLAAKHLDVDLTQPEFWQSAIDLVLKDLDEFDQLAAKFA